MQKPLSSKEFFTHWITTLENAGRKNIEPNFTIHKEDYLIIYKLLIYFYKDTKKASQHNININKGILLTGPIGCGKTSLMTIFRLFMPLHERFVIKSTRDITYEFIQDSYPIINKYSKGSFQHISGSLKTKAYCFDDLGVESNIKHYGNETNVMAEILLSRYDLFITQKMMTHVTTNLSASEIEEQYGNRVRSRMRQMLNIIAFNQKSSDKRK